MTHASVALTYEEIVEEDLPELMRVMTQAFDDDALKHLGQERGGPEGHDRGARVPEADRAARREGAANPLEVVLVAAGKGSWNLNGSGSSVFSLARSAS